MINEFLDRQEVHEEEGTARWQINDGFFIRPERLAVEDVEKK